MKKYLFILLISPLLFTSCSDDHDTSCSSFLECNDNSVWNLKIDGEDDIYMKFIDNKNDPFNYWYEDDDCYEYFSFLLEDENMTIIENTKNSLKIKTVYDEGEYGLYENIWIFTISGDIITLKIEEYKDGKFDGSEQYTLTKSSVNIDDLKICVG